MSVLVEALSVVTRRSTLDDYYPGGTDSYLQLANSEASSARLACVDEELTSVSFLRPADAQQWIDDLAAYNIFHIHEGQSFEIVCIDQRLGPTTPCDWIEWRIHPDGFTHCWLAGTEPGLMIAPEGWTPKRSRRLTRREAGDDSHRMVPLAVEDGLEYWLDLSTGRQILGLPERPSSDESDEEEESLIDTVRAAVEHLEWRPDFSGDHSIRVRIAGKRFNFALILVVDEDARTFVAYATLPVAVEPARRAAVAEVMTRINYRLRLGTFDLDFDDGEMRFGSGCDVEGGTLTQHMALTVIGNVCASVDRYGSALMRVMFGDVSPEDAAAEVLAS